MFINKDTLHKYIQRYSKEEKIYQTFADILEEIFLRAVKLHAPFSIIQTRTKSISSLAEKIIRKNKYTNPLQEITDLCGARIITQTQQQVKQISQFIRENFIIDWTNSLDTIKKLQIKEFGYRSVHFIVTPLKNEILGVKIPKNLQGKKAEIQVRTILQHTWADIVHDRIYKTTLKIPLEWERESARLAALLENADENITRSTSLIDSYTANYGNSMNREFLYNEIETLKTILETEPVNENKPILALKIARLARFPGDWELIIKLLNSFISTDSEVKSEIRIELGYALCKKYKQKRRSAQYKRGLNYLTSEARLNGIKKNKTTNDIKHKDDSLRIRLMALQYFADINEGIESDELIKNIYKTIYELDSENPYLFAKLLEYDSSLFTNITVIQKNVIEAINKCREHIRLGIESVSAYFTIGRLSLILKENQQALNAYLKAVDLGNSNTVCTSKEIFENEIESLSKINSDRKIEPSVEWTHNILLLSKFIQFNDSKAIVSLGSKYLKSKIFKEPVIIVVGGADNLEKQVVSKFKSYLIKAVKRFSGTLISGGTKSGIPGILGSAVEKARRNGNKQINLIGYIPLKTSKDTKVDKTYKLIKTNGIKFSPLESVQMWIDLISGGIRPGDVRVLGINGGKIANVEYRLALSLGAHVGVVKNTGDAADEILNDFEWSNHQNLHTLPDDAESLWAFVNYNITPTLNRKQLEDTAKTIHNNYLKSQSEQNRDELNLKPWNELKDELKDSNISQAVYMCEILNLAGFGIRKVTAKKGGIMKFKKEDIIKMSKLEHGRFVVERLIKGWRYGHEKDIEKKINPSLVAWDEIPKKIQKLDIDSVTNFPSLLKEAGYEIYPL